ncbi:hypothetical protein ACIGFL_18515 [Pseudomonas sp. NPDC077649]|uniref:hypothetical protein n=1 Tax=Pseudomonas sp. NPDC077649 TaxID=3364423 RepID=UPI0037C86570
MKPSFSGLVAAKNGQLAVTLRAPNTGGTGAISCRSQASLGTDGNGILTLSAGIGSPPGMWVHYVETRAAYGIAEAGETWSASGPFSGCQIVVGSTDGRVFVAHLAQQSGSTADTDWSGRGWKGDVWGRWKVPVPSYDFYSNSVVFVDWSKGASPKGISVVRVDLRTRSMGGFDNGPMEIFNVVQVA